MKYYHKFFVIFAFSALLLPGCSASNSQNSSSSHTGGSDHSSEASSYTVIWKNWDGSVLETDTNVAYGSTPSYDGSTPTRSGDSKYSYTFSGWSPTISSVTANQTYTAQFNELILIQKVYFYIDYLRINVGDSYTFNLDVVPSNATEQVVFQCNDDEMVSIKSQTITALKAGDTTLFVETLNGSRYEVPLCIIDIEKVEDVTIDNWSNPAYFKTETANISDIQFKFGRETYKNSSIQKLEYSMKLTKTFCKYSGSYKFKINWKMYDPNNTVIDSGTFTSASFDVGETTILSDFLYVDWSPSFKGGTYRIVLSDVAW